MAEFEIRYKKISIRIMKVEAENKEEAKQKYYDFDCIEDFEKCGIEETIENINKL